MNKEFKQTVWDDGLRADWDAILRLAIREDLGDDGDWTTNSLVDENANGSAAVVARKPGVVAGLPLVAMTLAAVDGRLEWVPQLEDGQPVGQGSCAGIIHGPVRGMLSAERIVLNMICRLSGIASLTQKYVEAVAGTGARIYDTRKTTPGWRRLEKYAVRCGGGWNHRGGLFEAVLIKDNHLAWGGERIFEARETSGATGVSPVPGESTGKMPVAPGESTDKMPVAPGESTGKMPVAPGESTDKMPVAPGESTGKMPVAPGEKHYTPADAVRIARGYVEPHSSDSLPSPLSPIPSSQMIIEVEVDTLEQLEEVLPAGPDIVLLDNMPPEQLRRAVAIRNRLNAEVELEASGGIDLQTIRGVAESGVERISVGALTHSAVALDFGLDWRE